MPSNSLPDILLISTADWDNPYWTNKQHVAVELARRGYRILYVEAAGGRRPTATAQDFRRIWKRLRTGLRMPRHVRPNIWVWSPLLIPLHANRTIRGVNRLLLRFGLSLWSRVLGLKPGILWTYSPLTTEFYDISSFDLCVYHAVDDMKVQPGMPREAMEAAENVLSRTAGIIFTTSPNLQANHSAFNPSTYYFSNVADFEHFNRALSAEVEIPADLAAIPGPRLGFIGAVSAYKLDVELIRGIAKLRPHWSLVFIGEVGEGDPLTDISVFRDMPNVHLLGGRPYSSLPAYLKGIDIAILPNRQNDYTKSMFPMKFFEYLAAGRPVVSTPLPALSNYADIATFAEGSEAFVKAVEGILAGDAPSLEARLESAREQTYEVRTEKMLRLVRAYKASDR